MVFFSLLFSLCVDLIRPDITLLVGFHIFDLTYIRLKNVSSSHLYSFYHHIFDSMELLTCTHTEMERSQNLDPAEHTEIKERFIFLVAIEELYYKRRLRVWMRMVNSENGFNTKWNSANGKQTRAKKIMKRNKNSKWRCRVVNSQFITSKKR